MRASKGRRLLKVMSRCHKPTSSQSARFKRYPGKYSSIGYERPIEECSVENLLQDHLENRTRFFLKEECTSKKCYVRIERLFYDGNLRIQQPNLHQYSGNNKKANVKKKSNQIKTSDLERKYKNQHQVSTLSITIPRISKKRPKNNTSTNGKTQNLDHAGKHKLSSHADDCSKTHKFDIRESESNRKVEEVKEPVIIPFKRRKNIDGSAQHIQGNNQYHNKKSKINSDSRKHFLSNDFKIENQWRHKVEETKATEKETSNAQKQPNNMFSDILKNYPALDDIDGSETVSLEAPNILIDPSLPISTIQQENREFVKGWGVKWNSDLGNVKKKKTMIKRWKEKWIVELKVPYGGGLPVLFKRNTNQANLITTPTTKQVPVPHLKFVTDQEISDGLPDIFDFDS